MGKISGTGAANIPDYIEKLVEMEIDRTCERYGEVAVAAMELGEVGQTIKDPDEYVRKSLVYIEKNVPLLTKN